MKSRTDELGNLPEDLYGLTLRELVVLGFVARGMTRKEIADRLNLSIYTVDTHLTNAYRKLGVKNGFEAVAKLLKHKHPADLTNVFC